jgi:hypothetical protein
LDSSDEEDNSSSDEDPDYDEKQANKRKSKI